MKKMFLTMVKLTVIGLAIIILYGGRYEILDTIERNVVTEQELSIGPVSVGKVRKNLKGEVIGYDF